MWRLSSEEGKLKNDFFQRLFLDLQFPSLQWPAGPRGTILSELALTKEKQPAYRTFIKYLKNIYKYVQLKMTRDSG